MITAAIYARISSDRDGDQLGVTRQIEDCRALVARNGWSLYDTFVDDDTSAYTGKPRPAYRDMMEAIEGGQVNAVVVWHLDRLHRSPRELEDFIEACNRAGLRELASLSGNVDLGNTDSLFLARILGNVARKESDDKSRRIKRKHLELAQAGRISGGGTRPFGFEPDRITVRQSEAAVIREVAERILAGDSLRSVCRDLDDRAIPTVSGKGWSLQVVRRLLLSGRISGQRDHHGESVAPAEWPAIITPDQTARLRALLRDPARRTNRTARRYLLTGLLRCGVCGERLVARPREDGRRRYICAKGPGQAGCGGIAILADDLEAFVSDAVLWRLDTPELARALAGHDTASVSLAALASDLERDRAQLEEVAQAYGQRQITLAELLAARKPVEARITAARQRLADANRGSALTAYVGHADTLRTRWADLPLTRQHAIVAAVLDSLTVKRAVQGRNRFDSRRLVPVWRL